VAALDGARVELARRRSPDACWLICSSLPLKRSPQVTGRRRACLGNKTVPPDFATQAPQGSFELYAAQNFQGWVRPHPNQHVLGNYFDEDVEVVSEDMLVRMRAHPTLKILGSVELETALRSLGCEVRWDGFVSQTRAAAASNLG